jgi:hypothetical protein
MPQISIPSYINDWGFESCVPFAPGIPELYNIYRRIKWSDGINHLAQVSLFAEDVAGVTKGLQSEHKVVDTDDMMDHFIRQRCRERPDWGKTLQLQTNRP